MNLQRLADALVKYPQLRQTLESVPPEKLDSVLERFDMRYTTPTAKWEFTHFTEAELGPESYGTATPSR